MTPGTRISVGRVTCTGTVIRTRGPFAQVKLDGMHKPVRMLLSSLRELTKPEEKIIPLFHVEQSR